MEIADQQYATLLADQSKGKVIDVVKGVVVSQDPPSPTDEEMAAIMRARRNELLTITDRVINAAEDAGGTATAWRQWRVTLRNLPTVSGWPNVSMPKPPTDGSASTSDQTAITVLLS
ncbi:phage tail assembly chaperone [Paraburkholderia sediminicola]|uniref:phage tail assembly chaperone n=1 Tax=Paraburkholderia sediminicola TaxID=458836 RepID=UPI0038B7C99E